MGRFDGQIAWVTGGGTGIGRGLAIELARQGAEVVVSGRRIDQIEKVAAEITALGRTGVALQCDVADESAVVRAVQTISERFGRLDVVIANAGAGSNAPFEELTGEEWRRLIDVNVLGVASTLRHALPEVRKTRGRVAVVGSVNSVVSIPGSSLYSATKFAVRGMGLALMQELHGSGVSCTMLYPGFVESDIAKVDRGGRVDLTRKDPRPNALMWPADKAARVMIRAVHRRRREVVITGHGVIGAFIGQHLPGLVHLVMSRAAPSILRIRHPPQKTG